VGIGTPSPQERLEVVGNLSLNTSHGVAYVGEVKSSRTDGGLYVRPDTGAGLYLGPANELTINDGNVGIGSMDPSYPLQVLTSSANAAIWARNMRTGNASGIQGYAMGTGYNYALLGYADGGSTNYGLFISSGDAYVEGNVGVGTTNPQARLHVSDTTSVVIAKIENSTEDGNAFFIAENDSFDWYVGVSGADADRFFIALPEDPKLTITTDGAVGIGTIDPTDDLHVVGDIYCTGKLTSDGGNDPPYVLYNRETREAIRARVEREVPKEKQDGAVLFWNGQTCQFEVYLPEEGEFRDLAGNLLATVEELTASE
jgi:hypothetical protein